MTDRQMIESRCKSEGWTIERWSDGEDGVEAHVASRAKVVEDDEDVGLYSGDEGQIAVSIVGAEKYRNRRVFVALLTQYHDAPTEVRDLSYLELI